MSPVAWPCIQPAIGFIKGNETHQYAYMATLRFRGLGKTQKKHTLIVSSSALTVTLRAHYLNGKDFGPILPT